MTEKQRTLLGTIALVLFASHAWAQTTEVGGPDQSKVRVRFGPVMLNPAISVTNLGVDNNVFNEPANPKSDFTFTATPRAEAWLRVGRTWLNGVVAEDIVWYQKYASERSDNTLVKFNWTVPLTHFTARLGGEHVNTNERPGFEIDVRAQRSEMAFTGGIDMTFLAKTSIGVSGERRTVNFDEGTHFLGTDLHDALSRVHTAANVNLSHQLTPLTGITFSVGREQERFEFDPLRDSDSTSVQATFRFDPFALLKGTASIGYRDFAPLSASLPGYKGSRVAVDLGYAIAHSTRIGVRAMRDVQYSFEKAQPYFLQTGGSIELTQQIYGPLDLVGRASIANLAYRSVEGAVVVDSERTDQLHGYGGGVTYALSPGLRLGVNIDHTNRTSILENREYEGLRLGTSVSYGF